MKEKYIIYRKSLCIIESIKDNKYILKSVEDPTLKMQVPINMPYLRKLVSKQEIEKIIKKIPSIPIIDIPDKQLENTYKELLASATFEDLIKIIKTTYIRNNNRKLKNKKISDRDKYYFNLAEKYLYEEFSVVLNLSYEDTKNYIINKINNIQK